MGERARQRSRTWFGTMLWLHRWTGLIATPFFLILCITGSILIFHDEVDRLMGDAPPPRAAPARPIDLSQLAQAGLRKASGKTVQTIFISDEEPDRAYIGLVVPGTRKLVDAQTVLVDRGTGAPLPFSNPEGSLTGIVLKLHAQWFAGLPGETFGSVIATLVFICLVSGVAIHAPFVRRMAFGVIRRGRGARLVQLDLHNLIGVVILGWAGLVTFTGICLGLGNVALGIWQDTELRALAGGVHVAPPANMVSVDRAAAAARAAMPERTLTFAIYPGTELSSPRHFLFLMNGRQPYNEHLFDIVLVDAGTGKVAAAQPLPWYLKAVVLSGPLHFGDYGGLALKLLWVTSAMGTLFITGNGAWLWWARRRKSSRHQRGSLTTTDAK